MKNIPFPADLPLSDQRRIVEYLDSLRAKLDALRKLHALTAADLDALMPSILDKAFKGELVGAEPSVVEVQRSKPGRLFDTSADLERDYAIDAAVAVLVLDDYRRRGTQAREFHQQKLVYIAQRVLKLPVRSQFVAKAAGPWSSDLRGVVKEMADDHDWFRYVPRKDRPGDLAQPGSGLIDGVTWAKEQLGPRAANVRSLLHEVRRFGDAGLERWATILMVADQLHDDGKPVTRRAIQNSIDTWPGKRNKKWFSKTDVNKAIDGLVAKGWLTVTE